MSCAGGMETTGRCRCETDVTTAITISRPTRSRAHARGRPIAGAVGLVGAGLLVAVCSTLIIYNRLVRSAETVDAAWAQVANVMRRRSDLLPNLVAVTAAHAAHERALLDSVSAARNAYTASASLADQVERMRRLEGLTARMLATEERYPELKSSRVYEGLRFELLGTENRIATERSRYNEAVRAFRTLRRRWPSNIVARAFSLPDPPAY